jgi:hypothetical protein
MELLTAVFSQCSKSAVTGAGCALALVYMCTYIQAVNVGLGSAAVTAGFSGPLGLAVSGAVAVVVAALQALCYLVPKFSGPVAAAGAVAERVAEGAGPGLKPPLPANVDLAAAASCLTESQGSAALLADCAAANRNRTAT